MRSISSRSSLCSTLISLLAATTAIGSMNTVAPLADVSCTSPGTLARCSALTGMTYRPPRMVMMFSCKYLEVAAECVIRSSCSRILDSCSRMRRRMDASSDDAVSAISSSDRIADVIASSKYLLGTSAPNSASSDVSTPALLSRHCARPRMVRSVPAISSSSRMVSTLPASARRKALLTLRSPPNAGPPNRASSICASRVWFMSARAKCRSHSGVSESASSRASGQAVKSAKRSRTLSSSRAR